MRFLSCLLRVVLAIGVATTSASTLGQAPPPMSLRVIAFDGGWNLPVWAAAAAGLLRGERRCGSARLHAELGGARRRPPRRPLRHRDCHDRQLHRVPGRAGRGETQRRARFRRRDGRRRWLPVGRRGPGIRSFADLKGKTLSVDAMTTGLAFVLRELVARAGLSEADVTYVRAGGTPLRYRDLIAGKHDATLLRTPFELLARERGLTVLATAESLGAYQGSVTAVRRSWAKRTRPLSSASCARTGRPWRGSTIRPIARSPRRCWSPTIAT